MTEIQIKASDEIKKEEGSSKPHSDGVQETEVPESNDE